MARRRLTGLDLLKEYAAIHHRVPPGKRAALVAPSSEGFLGASLDRLRLEQETKR